MAKQLNNYIDSEGLSNVNHSAYGRLHSTESALLIIQNDIAALIDSGKAVALTLLDLTAAFDTINHDILFNSLRDWFGVDGTVLRWMKSYLSNHKQKVKLGNCFSDPSSLPYGVPQGSVLGPLLFTLYTTPLSNIISNFNVTHHLYADDTQIYLALDHRNFDSSFAEFTECLTCVQNWMAGVKLKLSPEKTEFIIIGDRQARESPSSRNSLLNFLEILSPLPIQSRTKVLLLTPATPLPATYPICVMPVTTTLRT